MATILNFCSFIGFQPFCTKKNFTHSFWLNLVMAAILNSAMLDSDTAILDSDTLLSSLRFTQKHSHSTLTLTQTHSFSLNLMMAAILNSAILDSAILVFPLKLIHTCQDWFPPFCTKKTSLIHWFPPFAQKKTSLIHSDSTWWWQPYWILPSWIQTPCYLLSGSLKNTLSPLWLWLKLIQSDSNSFILTQLDDDSHLEFHHLGFSHLSFSSQTHSHLPRFVPTICTKKKTSFTLPSAPFAQKKKLHSFILTQLDDGSHLEFCHVGVWHLVSFSQIHSKTLSLHSDSDSN